MPSSGPRALRRHRGAAASRPHSNATAKSADGGGTRSKSARLGELTVTYFDHGPMALDGEDAWGTDPEMLRFAVVLEGEVSLRHPDLSATLVARDSVVIPGTAPVTYRSDAARIVVCDMPAEGGGLTALPRSVPFAVGRVDAAVPCALGAFLLDLLRQDLDRLTPLARSQAADVLRTLLAGTVSTLLAVGTSGWEERRQCQAALRHIAARYTDPSLSSASVAEHLGVSRRSLQRIFEGQENSVAGHIQHVRAQHAVARLKDPRLAAASMTEIATLSGFGSTVAMRRAVVAATGQAPSDLRRAIAGTDSDV